jgi:hypothetical protein
MPMFTLPAEIVLHIFSFLQNNVCLIDYYVAFKDIRALMHSHPRVFYNKDGIYNFALPFSIIDTFFGDNNSETLLCIVDHRLTEHVPEVLQRENCDPTIHENAILDTAVVDQNIEVVKLLLADKRVDPTVHEVDENFIHSAVRTRNTILLKLLLKDGRADPNENESLALRRAVEMKNTKMVELLLIDGRADPTVDYGVARNRPIIQHAVSKGYSDIVSLLLDDERMHPLNIEDILFKTGDTETAKFLLEKGRIQSSDEINRYFQYTLRLHSNDASILTKACLAHECLDFTLTDNYDAINYAFTYMPMDRIKILIEHRRFDFTDSRCRLFQSAITHGKNEILEMLLADPRVNADNIPRDLLDTATMSTNIDGMVLLLKNPLVDITTTTPEILDRSVRYKCVDTLPLVLSDPRFSITQLPRTFVLDTVRFGHTEILRTLLTHNLVDFSTFDPDILRTAVCSKHTDILKLLLADPRVDPSIPLVMDSCMDDDDDDTSTLLNIAISTNVALSVSLLLSHPKIDPSINGNDAILEAAHWCNVDIIRLLVNDPRVDPSVDNNYVILRAVRLDDIEAVKCLYAHPKVAATISIERLLAVSSCSAYSFVRNYLTSINTN